MDKVSVIITSYKADSRLDEAINSVLNQTYSNYEIIVVDDNNPDTPERLFTEQLMEKYNDYGNIIYIKHEKNKNGAAARNTGIETATGSYIAFLDDDDYYYPTKIEETVKLLEENPEYSSVYTSVEVYRDGRLVKSRTAEKSGYIWKELLLNEGLLGTGSNLFFKSSAMRTIGDFDERFIRFQDVEYMLRFSKKYRVLALDKVLIRRNIKMNEKSNVPEYIKLKNNKLLIFDKFKDLIEELNSEERNCFYTNHYLALLHSAIMSGNRKYIEETKNELMDFGYTFSLKEVLCCNAPKLYRVYLKMRMRERKR